MCEFLLTPSFYYPSNQQTLEVFCCFSFFFFFANCTLTGLCPRARLHHHGHHQARTWGGGHRRDGRFSGREDDSSEGVWHLDGERQRPDPKNEQGHEPVPPGGGVHHRSSLTARLLQVPSLTQKLTRRERLVFLSRLLCGVRIELSSLFCFKVKISASRHTLPTFTWKQDVKLVCWRVKTIL